MRSLICCEYFRGKAPTGLSTIFTEFHVLVGSFRAAIGRLCEKCGLEQLHFSLIRCN
jgi:hypothetical protein